MKAGKSKQKTSKTGRVFMSYFISALFVTAAFSSGIQLIRFYNITDEAQAEYDTVRDGATNEKPIPTSRFTAGAFKPAVLDANSGKTDAANSNVIVLNGDFDFLTPETDDDYDAGDPTVHLPAARPTPSLQSSVIKTTPAPDSGSSSSPRTTAHPKTTNGELDLSSYRGGMGIDFASLYAINSDIIGWIRIGSTAVDYPVVQADNNDYYLKKSFKKGKSSSGCPFLDFTNSYDPMDSNLVIYGHNMGNGKTTMFSTLLKYYDQSYYTKNPVISFDTLYGAGSWQIFAVFKFNIENISNFNYTQHNFGSAADFDSFISNACAASLYDCGMRPTYGDHLLTLSTCDRATYGRNGRCVIMARYTNGTLF